MRSVVKKNKMESARTSESRPVLEPNLAGIFERVQAEFGLQRFGEEKHAKLECAPYKMEYDVYDMTGGIDEVINYDDSVVSVTFRHKHGSQDAFLTYNVKTPYLEDQINFLKTLQTRLSEDILLDNHWLQDDERKTSVLKMISVEDVGEVYPFLRDHIKYRIKTF